MKVTTKSDSEGNVLQAIDEYSSEEYSSKNSTLVAVVLISCLTIIVCVYLFTTIFNAH